MSYAYCDLQYSTVNVCTQNVQQNCANGYCNFRLKVAPITNWNFDVSFADFLVSAGDAAAALRPRPRPARGRAAWEPGDGQEERAAVVAY